MLIAAAMKVHLRTIRNKEAEVEVDDATLIDVLLDAAVEKFKPDFQKESILLVFKGKVLAAEQTVGHYGCKDKDRIVVMSKKKRDIGATPKPKKVVEKPVEKPVETIAETAVDTSATTKEVSPAAAATTVDTDSVVVDPEKVTTLIEMGFETNEATEALKRTGGDVDAAAAVILEFGDALAGGGYSGDVDMHDGEALMSEITEQLLNAEGNEYKLPESHPLYEFTQSDAFDEIKIEVRRNPTMMPRLILEMLKANPELSELIVSHEEDFLKCLLGPHIPDELLSRPTGGRGSAPYMIDGEGSNSMGAIEETLTSSDKEAIARLMELGFDRIRVIEAYLACDKNEEAAANFLFDDQ